MARKYFEIPFQRYQNHLLRRHRSRDMSRRRNWVAWILSDFDDPYFNDPLTEKKILATFFSLGITTVQYFKQIWVGDDPIPFEALPQRILGHSVSNHPLWMIWDGMNDPIPFEVESSTNAQSFTSRSQQQAIIYNM